MAKLMGRAASLLFLTMAACASKDETKPSGGGSPRMDASMACAGDPRADAYAPNMKKSGENGLLTGTCGSA
jgi:hypothetical protein